jgi:hypothetical protein
MEISKHFKAYILGNEFEYGFIIDKKAKFNIFIGSSYGHPTFGIIDKNEQWGLLCLVLDYNKWEN